MINFLLFLSSLILAVVLLPISFLYDIIKAIKFKKKRSIFLEVALCIDIIGNKYCEDLFNDKLITAEGYKFGTSGQTISCVLGFNQAYGTLTKTGERLAGLLDMIEKDHCKLAMEYYLDNKGPR